MSGTPWVEKQSRFERILFSSLDNLGIALYALGGGVIGATVIGCPIEDVLENFEYVQQVINPDNINWYIAALTAIGGGVKCYRRIRK